MPMAGRKPKPDGQKRNRMPPTHEWVEVTDEPYTGPVPSLPPHPRPDVEGPTPPEPDRPLGRMGAALWERVWRSSGDMAVDVESLLLLCEQMDERVALRVAVLRDGFTQDRAALRTVDRQIAQGLAALGIAAARSIPTRWPSKTLAWWESVAHMPHCVLWSEADWQFALDTALVAAAFHAGDVRVANELRQREKVLGTTADARRDMRIRYVNPVAESVSLSPVVTDIASRRSRLSS